MIYYRARKGFIVNAREVGYFLREESLVIRSRYDAEMRRGDSRWLGSLSICYPTLGERDARCMVIGCAGKLVPDKVFVPWV